MEKNETILKDKTKYQRMRKDIYTENCIWNMLRKCKEEMVGLSFVFGTRQPMTNNETVTYIHT